MIKGACHCGNVRVEIKHAPDFLTTCNCSICHRLGALWGYYTFEQAQIDVKHGAASVYSWGEKNIELHRCHVCGCATHYATTEKCEEQRVGINFRMMTLDVVDPIPTKMFDGADSWKYVGT